MWHVGAPLRWIAAQEIIAFAAESSYTVPREICFGARRVRGGSFQTARRFRLSREALLRRTLWAGSLPLVAGSILARHVLAVAVPARSRLLFRSRGGAAPPFPVNRRLCGIAVRSGDARLVRCRVAFHQTQFQRARRGIRAGGACNGDPDAAGVQEHRHTFPLPNVLHSLSRCSGGRLKSDGQRKI